MPFLITVNRCQSLNPPYKQAFIAEFQALRAELDDMRAKYAALQAALNAGTAPGAGGYPNATMQLAAARFSQT